VKVTILGCGGSTGVPLIGEDWGLCDPTDPRNRRRRPAILVEEGGTTLLVDTGADMRQQLLDAKVRDITAVLWTHGHADHINGIDDLRSVNRMIRRPLDVYADPRTLDHVRTSFGYVFDPIEPGRTFYKPYLIPHEIDGPFQVGHVSVVPFVQDHGFSKSLGFRFGNVGYSTDVVTLTDEAFEILAGVDVWIVDALREAPHPTHAHLARTLGWIERLQPRRAILTHMGFESDYATISAKLPAHVEPGVDGMVIEV
jgi:phosphoribosyl 1,2-cyclic phosphate phosphodiesterase